MSFTEYPVKLPRVLPEYGRNVPQLEYPTYLDHIRRESARFREVLADCDPSARVPSCPDWDAADLLWHLAGVQLSWAKVVRHRPHSPEDPEIADEPEEVAFYLRRLEHGWSSVAVALVVGRFALPFLVLLPRAPKFDARWMAAVGGWITAMHYLDVYWLVVPAAAGRHVMPGLFELSALAAVAGTSVAFGALRMRGKPLVPVGDPALPVSVRYRSPT